MSSTSRPSEQELGHNQRGLVENILEESQYEAAIDMLFQLRAPQHKPYPAHIRQLIFLALHSPDPVRNDGNRPSFHDSPQKTKHMRTSNPITSKAVVSALDLLTSLLSTNSPEALGRALPSYASYEENLSTHVQEEGDSLLAKQALCIKTAKHCWEILEEGYIYRTQVVTSPKGKSKIRRDFSIDGAFQDETLPGGSHIIGETTWPVLNWLVTLFERDEQLREASDNARYSRIFLDQLPPPRGGSVTRWDFSDILNIVICCLGQDNTERQRLGYRLMAILINLTATVHVEMTTLVTVVHKHLLVTGRPDFFEGILSNLPSSQSIWRFKVYLCLKIANDGPSPVPTGPQIRPRPQARTAKTRATAPPENPKKDSTTPPQLALQSLPANVEILQCLRAPIPETLTEPLTRSSILHAKFQLVVAFNSAQTISSPESQIEWDHLIQQGKLAEALGIGFGGGSEYDDLYKEMLREYLRLV
ncbi:hypothetical protein FA15DRAFT_642120 [Coprinopsis marcescibilis]|uniref:Uncharacterized protein n=1 Tax=Coprinopsis marcescibilis TaxID=230819 RepID=A0A5C3KTQ7_COPMA|nr:hypothetical protein FA15DRAFT_642120 [Coprinopsis marcescibilis]